MLRIVMVGSVVAVLGLGAWAGETGVKAYDITIPAIPENNISIPEVAPVKIHYETSAVEEENLEPNASSPGLDRSIAYGKRTPQD